MKFTTINRIDPSLLGERVISQYSYVTSTGGSDDGMRRSHDYTVHGKVLGTIENETQNPDGTYTYEYSSRKSNDNNSGGIRNPETSEYDLRTMVEELLFNYNVHEFSTDLQDEINNIKDYYVDINANSIYDKEDGANLSYEYRKIPKGNEYYNDDETILWTSYERIRSESMDDLNKQLNSVFSVNDYILYLTGNEIKKTYQIKFGLDEIGENESVADYLKRMQLEKPKCTTFEEALKENVITKNDMKELIVKCKNLSAKEMSSSILEDLFRDAPELISHFCEREIPIDILRKYNPNFDISKVNPKDLTSDDLDNVLKNVIQDNYICGIYNGPSAEELKKGYVEYLEGFLANSESLKKIIPVINTSHEYFFRSKAKNYIDKIDSEIMNELEIRDILLETENIELNQLLDYDLKYDKESAEKLKNVLGKQTSNTSLEYINKVLDIMKKNGVENDKILQALRENKFNIRVSNCKEDQEKIAKFKSFDIEGITIDDLRNSILKEKNFILLEMSKDISLDEMTREYNILLNNLAENKGKNDDKVSKRYEEIYDLVCNYSNAECLFSRLTPDVKDLTKRIMIESLDVIEDLQKNPIGYYSKFSRIMDVMNKSFDMTEEDMTKVYMKCLNNGANKEEIVKSLNKYMPEEKRNGFEQKINKENIYPNPKYFWLTDKNLKRINIGMGENRATIKNKIQSDGRCFSTKLKTDMCGESNDGKKIPVNNLSKWLFGVPGAKGNLTVTRSGDYIQLPGNTPDEAINLIENVMMKKDKDEFTR